LCKSEKQLCLRPDQRKNYTVYYYRGAGAADEGGQGKKKAREEGNVFRKSLERESDSKEVRGSGIESHDQSVGRKHPMGPVTS